MRLPSAVRTLKALRTCTRRNTMATISMTGEAAPQAVWSGFKRLLVKLRFVLAGLAGVLVLVPPLIKGVGDIYKELNHLPRNEVEAVNAEMFRKHFGRPPVYEADVPVAAPSGQVTVPRISVYDSGDIWVKYGEVSQWFRFPQQGAASPRAADPRIGWSWLPSAHAQAVPPAPRPAVRVQQHDEWLADGVILRQVRRADGSSESWRINTNTGRVVRVTPAPPVAVGAAR
jgi:hypothetical protein